MVDVVVFSLNVAQHEIICFMSWAARRQEKSFTPRVTLRYPSHRALVRPGTKAWHHF